MRFAFAAVSDVLAWASAWRAAVSSTLAITCPLLTLSPALTATSDSCPPVVKFTPASLGDASEPAPVTVACTFPVETATVRLSVRGVAVVLSEFTAA